VPFQPIERTWRNDVVLLKGYSCNLIASYGDVINSKGEKIGDSADPELLTGKSPLARGGMPTCGWPPPYGISRAGSRVRRNATDTRDLIRMKIACFHF
jgi:hypothetical protein